MKTKPRFSSASSAAIVLPPLCFALCATPRTARAQTSVVPAPATPPGAPATEVTKKADDDAEAPGLRVGTDFYAGFSNLDGFRRIRDGFWAAGSSLAYPSAVYLRWTSPQGAQVKVAVGVGQLYNGSTAFKQPHEAWWKQPLRGKAGTLTLGKFYVPFALQEWEYETKWGAQWEREWGATGLAGALTYNRNTEKANGYARIGHQFGENLLVGVSLAAGRGISYDSVHDKAIGADFTARHGDWQALGEYVGARGSSAERFRFLWARLNYDGWKKLKPFVARYDYADTTGSLGTFRSYSVGSGYKVRENLTLEGGRAFTDTKNIWWLQLHWTPEKLIK